MNVNNFQKLFRKLFPLPTPPKEEDYENVCELELVPHDKLIAMYKRVLKKHSKINTSITHLEFGVFNGTSLSAAIKAYKELGYSEIKILAFDSYQGLPAESSEDDGGVWMPGKYYCSKEKMLECLKSRGVDSSEINFVDGWYNETLNDENRQKLKLTGFDIAFIDCDTYKSSSICLNFLKPILKSGAIIIFDDWRLHDLDIQNLGEKKAFLEFKNSLTGWTWKRFRTYNRKSEGFRVEEI